MKFKKCDTSKKLKTTRTNNPIRTRKTLSNIKLKNKISSIRNSYNSIYTHFDENIQQCDCVLLSKFASYGEKISLKKLFLGICFNCGQLLYGKIDSQSVFKIPPPQSIATVEHFYSHVEDFNKNLYQIDRQNWLCCRNCKTKIDFKMPMVSPDNSYKIPKEITDLRDSSEISQLSLCGLFSSTFKKTNMKTHTWRHIQGEVNILHKHNKHYYGMFTTLLHSEKVNTKNKDGASNRIGKALKFLKANNHLYVNFFARYETLFRFTNVLTSLSTATDLSDKYDNPLTCYLGQEQIGALTPTDVPYKIPQIYPNEDVVGTQNPKSCSVNKTAEEIKKIVNVSYSDEHLEAKAMPHLFPFGIGSWKYEKGKMTMSVYYKGRILNYDNRWRQDPHWSFFWFDRHMKSTLYQYNISKRIQVTNRTDKLTKKKLSTNSSYHAYGTNVPQSITGSRSYWQSRYLDLLALTSELGQPTFFITLTQNDSWDELESYLNDRYGRKTADNPCVTNQANSSLTSVILHPAEMTVAFFERFKSFRENILLQKSKGPLGVIEDYWWRIEFQKRGGLHVHMVVWCKSDTVPNNAVCAEMPRGNSFANVEVLHKYVKKFQLHLKCYPDRCLKGPNGKVLTKCKYGFPAPLNECEKLDESGVRYLYVRRNPVDKIVVPYNMCILLMWQGHMNIQKISHGGWQMYLAKYLAKSEPSFNTKISENMSDPECYLRPRIVGKLEVMTHLLHYNICRSSREIVYIPTDIMPKYRFLKRRKHMPENDNSKDIFYDTLIEKYFDRPEALSNLKYPDFVRQYRYLQPSESYNEKINIVDKKGRILRKRKEGNTAIPRHHFLLPFGEDQELYFVQLMLLNLPLSKETMKLSVNNESQTYMEECAIRNLLEENQLGMQLLTSALQRGYSTESITELASKLKGLNWITESDSEGFVSDIHTTFNSIVDESELEVFDDDTNLNDIFVKSPAKTLFNSAKLTKSQENVYEWLHNRFSTNQQTLTCLTGAAGTGKSYLVKGILNMCEDLGMCTALLATTGIAAWLIGGCTIHCFFKMNLACQSMIEFGTSDSLLLSKTEILIIDEFTMMESNMFTNIDKICRKFAASGNAHKFFGGKNIILVGDPAQLPAIKTPIYFTPQWFHFHMLVLTDIVRQSNEYFINVLHKIRQGHVDESVINFIDDHLSKENISDIDINNTMLIVSLRKKRDEINNLFIESLPGEPIKVLAIDTDLGGSSLDQATLTRLLSIRERLEDVVHVKVKARVMLTKNISVTDGWVNGTIALVKAFSNDCFFLQNINTGKILPLVRSKQTLTIPGCSYSIIRQQFPIIPAYAMTVHKVQGMTLNKVHIQLDRTFFASGQAYVAISRVTNHENLSFITADPQAIFLSKFYKELLHWMDNKNVFNIQKAEVVKYPEQELMKNVNKEIKKQDNTLQSLCDYQNEHANKKCENSEESENVSIGSTFFPPFPLPKSFKQTSIVHNFNVRIIDQLSHPVSIQLATWMEGLGFNVCRTFSNQQILNTCGYNACYATLVLRKAGNTFMTDKISSDVPTQIFYAGVNCVLGIDVNDYQDLTGEQIIQVIASFYKGKSLNWFDGPLSLNNFIIQMKHNYTNYIKCKRPCPIRICIVNTLNFDDTNSTNDYQGDHWISVAYSINSSEVIADNENPDDL